MSIPGRPRTLTFNKRRGSLFEMRVYLLKAVPVQPCFQWQEGAGLARRQGQSACRGTRATGSSRGPGGAGAATRGCPPQDGRTGNLVFIGLYLMVTILWRGRRYKNYHFGHVSDWQVESVM